ncbi:hypothetical protein D9758_006447 [Tetrapyrgos nigripes]|uniref:RNase H type-1 domain-containing protein n=1 Tax=Tetrapyrgos nigripes TaxID=182062 RepID=A0A8H5GKD3_9AGAR|nr:hypothetical protein D9758_006447 [Tetrapyrgos nigripes]
MTGAMRSAPTDLLEVHAKLLPVRLLLEKICFRSLLCTYTLPENHLLRKLAQKAFQKQDVKKYPPPLRLLPRLFSPSSPSKIETITPRTQPHTYIPSFTRDIAVNKDQAAKQERLNKRHINIYTDGSGIDNSAGAAAVLINKDDPSKSQVLRYYIGPLTQHNTYEAEGVGVILGLELLRKSRAARQEDTNMIGLDGKSVIEATFNLKHRPGQYILNEILRVTDALSTGTTPPLVLTWISGHVGLHGNELADEEAKRAAQGETGGSCPLPSFLRGKTLPASVSALKQHFHTTLLHQWGEDFAQSPRLRRFTVIDGKGVRSQFLDVTAKLARRQTSVLVQLRTGHIPLNAHLHRITKSDTPNCPHCETQGHHLKETVQHFIQECPAYQKERYQLKKELGRDGDSLKAIFRSTDNIKALLRYIGQTERLATTFGDVSHYDMDDDTV